MPHRLSFVLLTAFLSAAAHGGPPEDAQRRAASSAPPEPATVPAPTSGSTPAAAPAVAQSAAARPVSDAERSYVAPQATVRITPLPLRMRLNADYGRKFTNQLDRPQVTLSNPFLDPARLVLAEPQALQCSADGAAGIDGFADGPADLARFVKLREMCFAPDGTLYVLDEILVRRLDRAGQLTTWAF